MSPEELHERLADLARDVGLSLRRVSGRPGADGEPPARSAVCRVRGEVWVVLSSADPLEERTRVLVEALRGHAADRLESRYLPPAVRARLERPA